MAPMRDGTDPTGKGSETGKGMGPCGGGMRRGAEKGLGLGKGAGPCGGGMRRGAGKGLGLGGRTKQPEPSK